MDNLKMQTRPGYNSTCPNCGERVPFSKYWWNNTTGYFPCPTCKTCIEASARQMWQTFLVLIPIGIAVVSTGNIWAFIAFFVLGNVIIGLYRAKCTRFVISRSQDCNN